MALSAQRIDVAEVRRAGPQAIAARMRSHVAGGASVAQGVAEILARVRAEGDAAVLDYTRRHDTGGEPPRPLVVADSELDAAARLLDLQPGVANALRATIRNVGAVATASLGQDATVLLPQGHVVATRELPVASAAIYVPGGRAPYPSTVVMGVVTARAAGVQDVVVCSPPGRDLGQVDAVVLGACRLCDVTTVYRMGGAQAIAALAYGTDSVRRVDVIVGPGNLYVQEAKRQLSDVVGIDGFAGPSDLLVVLAPDADPKLAAWDLAAQAEHGAGSFVGALCPSDELLDEVARCLADVTEGHASTDGAVCVLVNTPDVLSAVEIADLFAPEHLQLIGAEAEALAERVRSAGCLFVGAPSATAFGDYVAGSNHVLPTAGAARFASSLSPRHFRRRMSEVRIGAAAGRLAELAEPLARAEGFVLHADSMLARRGLHLAEQPSRPAQGAASATIAGMGSSATRSATIERATKETQVRVWLALDGSGQGTRSTGVGFFDHMLDLLARHGRLDLEVDTKGDLQTGAHHTVEDTAIVIGQALDAALGDRAGITRYGAATVPMDESRASCAIDISGRPFTLFEADLPPGATASFDHELTEEFFRAIANAAKLTLHVSVEAGSNAHHMIEASFKAFARALRGAVSLDPTETGVPSTKGTLT